MFGVKLKAWGDYACFTRPEMKAERVSYDVITPSAARGILEAIYWKPSIRWIIDKIHVINQIRFDNIRRNEVGVEGSSGTKIPINKVKQAMKNNKTAIEIFIEDVRQQRAAMLLRDVCYVIEAHFKVIGGEDNNSAKHKEMFGRRAEKGQCAYTPYFGCREFPVNFELLRDKTPKSKLNGEIIDLGWMLYDIDFKNNMKPLFFKPKIINGIIDLNLYKKEFVDDNTSIK